VRGRDQCARHRRGIRHRECLGDLEGRSGPAPSAPSSVADLGNRLLIYKVSRLTWWWACCSIWGLTTILRLRSCLDPFGTFFELLPLLRALYPLPGFSPPALIDVKLGTGVGPRRLRCGFRALDCAALPACSRCVAGRRPPSFWRDTLDAVALH
jgi:hypothetical protein